MSRISGLLRTVESSPAGFIKMGQRWANVLNGLVIPP